MEDKRPHEEELIPDPGHGDEGAETASVANHPRPKKVYKGMWGTAEIATVGLALFLLTAAVAGYLFFTMPATRELQTNRESRDALEKELAEADRKFGDISSTETQVAKLVSSAEDFEARYLLEESTGKTAIYQRLNSLIGGFGLLNSTGPDYVPIAVSEDERRQGENERTQAGRSRFQSLFPGIYVTMTVEGSYVDLRRFLNEIENSSEYIVISTIELEPSESEDSAGPVADPGATTVSADRGDSGRTRGKVVSLRLELAAYFQRNAEDKLMTAAAPPANGDEAQN